MNRGKWRALAHLLGPRRVRLGFLEFQDPLLACGILYLLLYYDSSGFLRVGLLAACLHEGGHILCYLLLRQKMPSIAVTMTGFCMRVRGAGFTPWQIFWLAAAGPGANGLLAAAWYLRLCRQATVWDAAFFAANCLTGAFNLLPIPPLDGARMLGAAGEMVARAGEKRKKKGNCISSRNRVQ